MNLSITAMKLFQDSGDFRFDLDLGPSFRTPLNEIDDWSNQWDIDRPSFRGNVNESGDIISQAHDS
jgi:hypothetical protein